MDDHVDPDLRTSKGKDTDLRLDIPAGRIRRSTTEIVEDGEVGPVLRRGVFSVSWSEHTVPSTATSERHQSPDSRNVPGPYGPPVDPESPGVQR